MVAYDGNGEGSRSLLAFRYQGITSTVQQPQRESRSVQSDVYSLVGPLKLQLAQLNLLVLSKCLVASFGSFAPLALIEVNTICILMLGHLCPVNYYLKSPAVYHT